MGNIGKYWEILGNIGKYWEILGNIGKYWEILGNIGKYWEILGNIGKYGLLTLISTINSGNIYRDIFTGFYWYIFTGIQRDMMFGCLDLSENDLPSCHGNLMGKMIINHQILVI